jgi:hypothetical protein
VARVASAPVRISLESRDALTRLRLRIAGEIGRNITMDEITSILITNGQKHYQEIIAEAEKRT